MIPTTQKFYDLLCREISPKQVVTTVLLFELAQQVTPLRKWQTTAIKELEKLKFLKKLDNFKFLWQPDASNKGSTQLNNSPEDISKSRNDVGNSDNVKILKDDVGNSDNMNESIGSSSDTVMMSYNTTCTCKGFNLSFHSFTLDARLHYDNNLKLVFLLLHTHVVTISDIMAILAISRPGCYDLISNNPCFESEIKKVSGWGKGGRNRQVTLTKEATEYADQLEALCRYRLSGEIIADLESKGSDIRKGASRSEEENQRKLDISIRTLQRVLIKEPTKYEHFLKVHSELRGKDPKELDKLARSLSDTAKDKMN